MVKVIQRRAASTGTKVNMVYTLYDFYDSFCVSLCKVRGRRAGCWDRGGMVEWWGVGKGGETDR